MHPFTTPQSFDSIPHIGRHHLTVDDLAAELRLTPATIREWAKKGMLDGRKYGKSWRFASFLVREGIGMGRQKRYDSEKGLIHKNGSDYWYIKIGKKAVSTGTKDLNQATAMLYEERARVLRGMGGDSGSTQPTYLGANSQMGCPKGEFSALPFSILLNRYLAEISPYKSRNGASDKINSKMPLADLGNVPIDRITPQRVYQYQEWRQSFWSLRLKRPVSGATVNREVALIKHALKKAVRWGYLERSPVPEREVEGLHENKRKRYITDDEFQRILMAFAGYPLGQRIIQTLYYTAQRRGKILALQWRQVDLEHRTITFASTGTNKEVSEIVWINDPLCQIITDLQEERKRRPIISPFVFCNRDGSAIKDIKTAWKSACKKAGIQDIRIHDIRHKAITDMRRAGVSIDLAMKAAGHSNMATHERYNHPQIEDMKKAFEVLK